METFEAFKTTDMMNAGEQTEYDLDTSVNQVMDTEGVRAIFPLNTARSTLAKVGWDRISNFRTLEFE